MNLVHHCLNSRELTDNMKLMVLVQQERTLRLVLAAADVSAEECLDEQVPECAACYRDLIVELASNCASSLNTLYKSPEVAREITQDELAWTLEQQRESALGHS
jgi:hypothetical protein